MILEIQVKCGHLFRYYCNLSYLRLYNKIMFDQLLACFNSLKLSSEESVGRIIDLLRAIPYFQNINSSFGSDYLVLMIPILQPQILRVGFSLLGQNSQYLLIQGGLQEEQEQFQAQRIIDANTLIDLRDKIGVRFVARSDCKLIKIKKGQDVGPQIQKKLLLTEKERIQQMSKLKKLIKNKDHKNKLQFLNVIEFFNGLGEFDLLDLAVQSQIKEYHQTSVTHIYGEDVDNIGCILNGKVKVTFPANHQQSERGQGVSTFISEGEWIGLEEYLWEKALSSNGQASSITALLVWIPRDVFKSKFNLKTNYHTMNKLTSLIQTKKTIFDKGLNCRRKRQIQLNNQEQTLKYLNAALLQKISAMITHREKRNHFNKTKSPKPFEMPQNIVHKSNNIDPNAAVYLPKVAQRVNLFPDQYKETPISVTQLRQMQRLAKIANKIKIDEPKPPQTGFQHNPQSLYKTILSKIPQSYTPSINSRFSNTVRSSRFKQHSNSSFYNNFRINKTQRKGFSVPKSKTLSILS